MNGTIATADTDHGNQMKDDSINQEQQPRTHFLGHKQKGGGGNNQGSEVEKMQAAKAGRSQSCLM